MFKWTDIFNSTALFSEAQARRVCAKLCAQNPEQPRLKTIAAVGAYDAKIGGRGLDSKRLTGVMSYLLRSGFMIDPGFEIDVVNFRDKRDFLKEDKKADLVFVSFILADNAPGTKVYRPDEGEVANTKDNWWSYYGGALSDDNHAQIWRDRIDGCDAKMVVTYGGSAEIGTQVLCAAQDMRDLVPVIETPERRIANFSMFYPRGKNYDLKVFGDLKTLYNEKANDLPMPWLGFAARREYLSKVVPGLSGKTCLAQQALALQG